MVAAAEYKLLLPLADPETEPYWEGAKQGKLMLQRCASCKTFRFPPTKVCAKCYSEESDWAPASGKGKLYAYITVYQPVLPQWREEAPYNIVQVELDELPGVRITGNMLKEDEGRMKVGMPVQVVFDHVTDEGDVIPRWRLA